jgi:hypothetical protein
MSATTGSRIDAGRLTAPRLPLSSYDCDLGDGSDVAHLGPAFSCNNKLIDAL